MTWCWSVGWFSFVFVHLWSQSIYLIIGWLCRQCNWLPNGLPAEVSGYQSKQAWNESDALCCDGKWPLVLLFNCNFDSVFLNLKTYLKILFSNTNLYVYHSKHRRQMQRCLNFQNNSNTLKLQQGKRFSFFNTCGIVRDALTVHLSKVVIWPLADSWYRFS